MEIETHREQESNDLQFKPMTEGLGFHPFADGLPYAPVSKKPTTTPSPYVRKGDLAQSMGAGAVAAGAPRFATSIPQIRVPVATPAKPIEKKSEVKTEPLIQVKEFEWHYPLVRTLAYLLDTVFNFALASGLLLGVFWREGYSLKSVLTPETIVVLAVFLGGLNWALVLAQELIFGTSFGKKMFGLGIKGSVFQLLARAVLFVPSVLCLGIGLFWAVIDRKYRCWHDLFTKTQPIYITRL